MNNQQKHISIVTWFGVLNFGTTLQAHALYVKLEQLGYHVCLLHKIGVMRSIRNLFGRISRCQQTNQISLAERKLNNFTASYHIVNFYTINPIHSINRNTDVYITGSDQIWNTMFYWDAFYYLYFAPHKKKIAYSSSLGTPQINPKYRKAVKRHLSRFSHIGIREPSGVSVLSSLLGRNDIVSVPDPTFLLTAEDWRQVARDAVFELELPKDYIFVYFVGNRKEEYSQLLDAIHLRYNTSCTIIIPSFESGICIHRENYIEYTHAGPAEFVYLIKNAQIVCTDSFHATALSINMGKEFYVAKRFLDDNPQSQNSRIYDLLSHYGLQDRLYTGDLPTNITAVNSKVVQDIVYKDRQYGLSYLVNSIEH